MPSNEIHVSPDVLKRSCFGRRKPRYKNFYNIVNLLLVSVVNPADYVLNINAGRGGGVEACVIADLAGGRTVRAVEDDPKLVRAIASYTRRRANLRLRRGTIGDVTEEVASHKTTHGKPSRSYTLDHLAGHGGKWRENNESLGFVLVSSSPTESALALAGALVRGGEGVIARDRPIIAARLSPADSIDLGRLLGDVAHTSYSAYEIKEANKSHATQLFVPSSMKLPDAVKNILNS